MLGTESTQATHEQAFANSAEEEGMELDELGLWKASLYPVHGLLVWAQDQRSVRIPLFVQKHACSLPTYGYCKWNDWPGTLTNHIIQWMWCHIFYHPVHSAAVVVHLKCTNPAQCWGSWDAWSDILWFSLITECLLDWKYITYI